MEMEGFMRAIKHSDKQGLSIDVLVTDRNCQINKWVRESLPKMDHRYDIWHVAAHTSHKPYPKHRMYYTVQLSCSVVVFFVIILP